MSKHSGVERAIAVFKIVKGLALAAVAAGVLSHLHDDVAEPLQRALAQIRVDPGNHYVDTLLAKVSTLSRKQLEEISLGGFLYAALFLVEGVGLWLGKSWAEWFTVIVTGSFIPLEIYELVKEFTPLKVVAIAVNVAIVIYLIVRIRQRRRG